MPVFDIDAYLASLKTEFNIPDDKIPTQEIKGGFLRQDKFNQQMQAYDKRKAELDDKFKELEPFEKYLQTLETKWGPRENWSFEQVEFARGQEDNANRQPAGLSQQAVEKLVSDAVTRAVTEQNQRFSQLLENTQRGAALLIDFIPEARDEYRENYGGKYGFPNKFPKAEFEQFISPGDPANGVQPGKGYGMPLDGAWELFKQPYELKRNEATWEQKVKDAAEEAYRRGASQGPGSLEPFGGDITASAGELADRQNALPKDQQPAEISKSEKVARFGSAWDNSMKSSGSVAPVTPAPAAAK